MSASICTSNVTSGFIDLATFDEIEKYLYGGPDATAYFVRETRKSTWFTQVPVVLSRASGQPDFGQEWAVSISRAGDYLIDTWLRVLMPAVVTQFAADTQATRGQFVRWTQNLMHNLIHECCITFNDLVAARFDSFHLDFWTAFTVPASKRLGYDNMIGNTTELTQGVTPAGGIIPGIPAATLNLPLPFFYSRDSGVALPTAALPYNEMRINFSFRRWEDLLIGMVSTLAPPAGPAVACWTQVVPQVGVNSTPAIVGITKQPTIATAQVWANYAIVSNDERKRMACAPRDILIEQVQTAPRQRFDPVNCPGPNFDVRFSHAIKVLFFSVRNTTHHAEWSVYTTNAPVGTAPNSMDFLNGGLDPILQTSLIYENTQRLATMGSDYFSLVNPYYHAPAIPETAAGVTGYHMYSYSLDFICLDPMGSTNYGKLTNVSVVPEASDAAKDAADCPTTAAPPTTAATSCNTKCQLYEFVLTAVNNNIIRISGGALGFPVL